MTRYILLHGLGQKAASWDKVCSLMNGEQTFDTPELSGFLCRQAVSYEALYRAFAAYCEGFEEPLCLGGLSLGGILALHYGMEHPEKVRGLVLMAAQYSPPKGLMTFQNLVFRFLPKAAFRDTGLEKQDFIRLCAAMGALDLSGGLEKVACPVLVLCGEKDKANLPAAKALARRLKEARLTLIPGADHELNIQAPEALARELTAFFRQYHL